LCGFHNNNEVLYLLVLAASVLRIDGPGSGAF
jgi:hypothetical protein